MAILVEPVDSFVRQIVRKEKNAQIISAFDKYGMGEFKIAQRGDCLLANSGIKTGIMKIKPTTTEDDVMQFFMNNVRDNAKIRRQGMNLNA